MVNNYPNLNLEKARIWRIVHCDNLPWILDHGLHCANSSIQDPAYTAIGNVDLINRRTLREVPITPYGTLADYIPFYFTPFSPMMYNIYTGRGEVTKRKNEEICILVSSMYRVKEMGLPYAFTDRHAYPPLAKYFNDLAQLSEIDWPLLQARNFKRNADDPERVERYQAEALIYQHLPIKALLGVVCYTDAVKIMLNDHIRDRNLELNIQARPGWYF